MTYNLSPFLSCNFSVLNSAHLFLQFLLRKHSKNFFIVRITNKVYLQNNVFNFFNYKNFVRPLWSVTFCKNVFYVLIFLHGCQFQIQILYQYFLNQRQYTYLIFNLAGSILIVIQNILLYSLTILSKLLIYTIFWYWSHIFVNFVP